MAVLRTIQQESLKLASDFTSLNIDRLAPLDTLTTVVQTASGAHGEFSHSFAAPAKNAARPALGTEGLVGVTREDSGLALKFTEADGSVASIDHFPWG